VQYFGVPFSFEPLFVCKLPFCLKKFCGRFFNFFPKGEAPISKAKTENVNDKKQSVMKQAKPARGEGYIKGKISD